MADFKYFISWQLLRPACNFPMISFQGAYNFYVTCAINRLIQ